MSTYDFSTLHTTLPHHLIKDKLIDLIEHKFLERKHFIWFVTTNVIYSLPMCTKIIIYGLVKKILRPLFIFWIIFILDLELNFTDNLKVFRWVLTVLLLLQICSYFVMRDFMKSVSPENQADIIEAFNSTSRYLVDLLNIDNIYFGQMVNRIYLAELQLNKVNSSDTEVQFLDLNLSISYGTVSTKIYNKRDDIEIVNFPFLDGDVPRRTSYGVYISQLIRFARASSKRLHLLEQSPNCQAP